jgi:hypothetical protein
MSYGMDLIKQAERLMESGDLDTAEALVNKALRGALNNNNTADDNDFDSPSSTSMDEDGSFDDTDDDGEDEDNDGDLNKVSDFSEKYIHDHKNMTASVNRQHPAQPRFTDATSATGVRTRHKFDGAVDYIKERDGVSRNEAMTRARQEFPRVYQSFQEHLAN